MITVMAIAPVVAGYFVNILDTRSYPNKPTVEQLDQLNKLWEVELEEPYVVVSSTTDFANSLIKDMPPTEQITTLPVPALVSPSDSLATEPQLQLPLFVEA